MTTRRTGTRRTNPETIILTQVSEYLKLHGWYVHRVNENHFSTGGMSDLVAMKDGCVRFIEIKSKDGQMTDSQKRFMKNVLSHGCHYMVIRTLEEIQGAIL